MFVPQISYWKEHLLAWHLPQLILWLFFSLKRNTKLPRCYFCYDNDSVKKGTNSSQGTPCGLSLVFLVWVIFTGESMIDETDWIVNSSTTFSLFQLDKLYDMNPDCTKQQTKIYLTKCTGQFIMIHLDSFMCCNICNHHWESLVIMAVSIICFVKASHIYPILYYTNNKCLSVFLWENYNL